MACRHLSFLKGAFPAANEYEIAPEANIRLLSKGFRWRSPPMDCRLPKTRQRKRPRVDLFFKWPKISFDRLIKETGQKTPEGTRKINVLSEDVIGARSLENSPACHPSSPTPIPSAATPVASLKDAFLPRVRRLGVYRRSGYARMAMHSPLLFQS